MKVIPEMRIYVFITSFSAQINGFRVRSPYYLFALKVNVGPYIIICRILKINEV
jgi:hypothetical protein